MPLVRIAQVVLRTAAAAGLVLGLASSCKSRLSPEEPSGIVPEACCKVVSQDLQQGAGCRVASRCKEDEPIWMRGAVTCSPEEPEKCLGGRCCKYRKMYGTEDAVYNWEGDGEETTPAPAEGPAPATAPAPAVEPAPTAAPAPATEPAPGAAPPPSAAPAPAASVSPTPGA